MTVNISFLAQRKVIRFLIEGKVVKYFDDNWMEGIQILPSQTPQMRLMLKKMLLSRKPSIRTIGALIVDTNSGKNKEDYDACETEEDIAQIIRADCLKKGLLEVK